MLKTAAITAALFVAVLFAGGNAILDNAEENMNGANRVEQVAN